MIDHKLLLADSHADFETADTFWRSVSVPMRVSCVSGAQVLWINRRWFLHRGLDLTDVGTLTEVETWLLDKFAIAVSSPSDPPIQFVAKEKIVYADRYGGRGIGHSGGSGRCAYVDGFYVKGIGPTPLCDPLGPFFHTHGALPLAEALRETILSEVAGAEMPHGAVPSLAVIAIPKRLHHGDHDTLGEACALLIRPAFVRAGHFERASSFVAAKQSHHHRDADNARVGAWVRFLSAPIAKANIVAIPPNPITTFAKRVAEQMAFGRMHRLFHESYIASNLCMDGALADFGSFRSLINWEGAHVVRGMPSFGSEWVAFIRTVMMSLAFHVTHFSTAGTSFGAPINVMQVIANAERAFETRLQSEALALFGIDDTVPGAAKLATSIRRYFAKQNSIVRDYCKVDVQEASGAWLWNEFYGDPSVSDVSSTEAEDVRQALVETCRRSSFEDAQAHSDATARRTLLPRDGLYREALKVWIADFLLAQGSSSVTRTAVEAMVTKKVCEGRRLWSTADYQVTVKGQVMDATSSALLVRQRQTRKEQVLLRCPLVQGHLNIFGYRLPFDNATAAAQSEGTEIDLLCDVLDSSDSEGLNVSVEGRQALIPKMALEYVLD